MGFWEQLGIGSVLMAALTFLAKSLFTKLIERDQQNAIIQLQHKSDKLLDQHRSELEKNRLKFQIQYGGIFEQQAEAVLRLYKLVVKLDKTTLDLISILSNKSSADIEAWRDIYLEIKWYLEENEILFDENTVSLANKLISHIAKTLSNHRFILGTHGTESLELPLPIVEALAEAWEAARPEQERLKASLATSLRSAIGTLNEAKILSNG